MKERTERKCQIKKGRKQCRTNEIKKAKNDKNQRTNDTKERMKHTTNSSPNNA